MIIKPIRSLRKFHDNFHLNVVTAKAGEVALILVTHSHDDHASGAQRLRQLTGSPIRAFEPNYCNGAEEMHQMLLKMEKDRLAAMELPYRTIDIAGGDLGSSAARKFEVEVSSR